MIDFDGLTLGPAIMLLGEPFTFYPSKSQPLAGPVPVTAVFSSAPIDVELQDGGVFSDQQTTAGIQYSTWSSVPVRGDRIKRNKTGIIYWIADVDDDGQGGASLSLSLTNPENDL
jgi:hypothetical protein